LALRAVVGNLRTSVFVPVNVLPPSDEALTTMSLLQAPGSLTPS